MKTTVFKLSFSITFVEHVNGQVVTQLKQKVIPMGLGNQPNISYAISNFMNFITVKLNTRGFCKFPQWLKYCNATITNVIYIPDV